MMNLIFLVRVLTNIKHEYHTGEYTQKVSCSVFQLFHDERMITSLWKPMFFTLTVPTTIESLSFTITFSSETF